MRGFFALLISILITSTCSAQWVGGAFDQILAFGVHDTTLFVSTIPASSSSRPTVGRFIPSGANWLSQWAVSDAGIDFTQGNVTSFASLGKYFFANLGKFQRTYYSADNGTHWNISGGNGVASNGHVLLGTSAHPFTTEPPYIAISHDSGQTWDSVGNFNNGNWSTIYVTKGAITFAYTGSALWRSLDTDRDWMQLALPISGIKSFVFVDSILFAANGSIIRSSDWGTDWTQITIPRRSVSVLASSDSILLAGTDSGIFISTDLGGSWFNKSDGFGKYLNVSAIGTFHDSVFANALAYDGTGFTAVAPLSALVGTNAVREAPLANDSIEIYPNPAAGMVTIRSGGEQILGISVLNVLGEPLINLPNLYSSETALDLSHFASGTYFILIRTSNGQIARKIVRE